MAALMLGGCASYQFRIVEPVSAAGAVEQEAVVFEMQPLEYHLASVGDRLGVRVVNPTGDVVTLLGERSYVVDPSGETQPMRGGSIAPDSHITMLLPPELRYGSTAPRVGVGIGVGSGFRGGHVGTGFYGHRWSDYPRHRYVLEGGPYWQWTTGRVRLRLVYDQQGETFEHDFVFERVRVD